MQLTYTVRIINTLSVVFFLLTGDKTIKLIVSTFFIKGLIGL